MDYQCIVVYTIVRINPLYQITIENLHKERRGGCFYWIKNQIKRFEIRSIYSIEIPYCQS